MKQLFINFYYDNRYTLQQVRDCTTKKGTTKKLSYDEFYEIVGITVLEYDSNIDFFCNMKFLDVKAYLEKLSENIESDN